jgi:hypothetical protein
MKSNKPQDLYLLLNNFERESDLNNQISAEGTEAWPYFYLANWNLRFDPVLQRKIALQSPFRSHYYYAIKNAPLSNLSYSYLTKETEIDQLDLINQFIENQPTLTRLKKSNENQFEEKDLAYQPFSPPASETFAIILIKQGKISLAIDIYEKLILAKPEKRLYFATRISELTKLLTQE